MAKVKLPSFIHRISGKTNKEEQHYYADRKDGQHLAVILHPIDMSNPTEKQKAAQAKLAERAGRAKAIYLDAEQRKPYEELYDRKSVQYRNRVPLFSFILATIAAEENAEESLSLPSDAD